MILLNPGPVTLSARVRAALARPDLCHREPEFAALQSRIRHRLLGVYGLDPERWAAVLLTGSGTAAVEAMIASLVPADGTLLVVENGVYGERMSAIARAHGIRCRAIAHEWTDAVSLPAVAAALDQTPDAGALAVVHHETTSGRLNDLAPLAEACRERGVALLVDAVSSFGAEALDLERWGVAGCAATANKCLHGVPGAAFVIARRDRLAAAAAPARTVYLDLARYRAAQDAGGTPFTPSVQCFFALDEALAELADAGGWRARHAHYRRLAAIVEQGLTALGVAPLLARRESSVVLRAWRLPDGLDYETLHDGLKARGFVIYAGQGALARTLFRISTMGDLGAAEMERLVAAAGEVLAGR